MSAFKNTFLSLIFSLVILSGVQAQFHTILIPQPSPKVTETQRLGITDITVDYSSPAARGRDVWNNVVGTYESTGLAWRAGANMNTTIEFTTDVNINGNPLPAGKYGFHVLINDPETWTLLFAHQNNQWGSYYLDLDEHIALKVPVQPTENELTEQLDYKFINRTDSTLLITLDWGAKRIPFTVGVDLNKTVIENFRKELLGVNTYRWEAWNDAALWCLGRNTNLEEALDWATRSIEGGYNGFAANKNFTNVTTKARILTALGNNDEAASTFEEAIPLMQEPGTSFDVAYMLTDTSPETAAILFEAASGKFEGTWFIHFGYARALYKAGEANRGLEEMKRTKSFAPEQRQEWLDAFISRMENGEVIN